MFLQPWRNIRVCIWKDGNTNCRDRLDVYLNYPACWGEVLNWWSHIICNVLKAYSLLESPYYISNTFPWNVSKCHLKLFLFSLKWHVSPQHSSRTLLLWFFGQFKDMRSLFVVLCASHYLCSCFSANASSTSPQQFSSSSLASTGSVSIDQRFG